MRGPNGPALEAEPTLAAVLGAGHHSAVAPAHLVYRERGEAAAGERAASTRRRGTRKKMEAPAKGIEWTLCESDTVPSLRSPKAKAAAKRHGIRVEYDASVSHLQRDRSRLPNMPEMRMTLSMDRAELLRSNKEKKKEKVGGSESGGSRPSTSGGSRPSTSSSSSSAYCRSEPAMGTREEVQAPQPFRKRLMQPKPTYGCPHCAYRCWTSEEMRRHAAGRHPAHDEADEAPPPRRQ
eukprot:COSAG04_NODE_133_length_23964_cov_7.547999_22_plen_236_part_00